MIHNEHDAADVDVHSKRLWGSKIVAFKVVDNQSHWYISEGLYSCHKNDELYMNEIAVVIWAL